MIARRLSVMGCFVGVVIRIFAVSLVTMLMIVPAKAQMSDAVYKLRAKAVYTQLAGLAGKTDLSASSITALTNEMKVLSRDSRFSNLYSSLFGTEISYDLFQELPKTLKPLLSNASYRDFRNQFVLFYAATFEFGTDALGTAGFWVALTNEELRSRSFSRRIMKINHNSFCSDFHGPVRTVPVICHMSVARDTFEAIGGSVAALFWARQAAETAETLNIKDPEVLGDVWKNLVRLERSHGSYEQAKAYAIRFNTLKRENPVDPNWLNGRVFSNGFVHPLLGDFLLADGKRRDLSELSRSFLENSKSISWIERARLVRGFQQNKVATSLRRRLEKALLANPAGYTTPYERSERRFSRNKKLDLLQLTLGPGPCQSEDLNFLLEKNARRKLRLASACLDVQIEDMWNFGSEDSFMRGVHEVAEILGILGYRSAEQTYYQASLMALSGDKRLERVRSPQSLDDALAHLAAHSSEVRRHIQSRNLKGALSNLEAIADAADTAIGEVSGNEPGNISKLVPLLRPSIRSVLDLLNDVSALGGKKANGRVVEIVFRLLQLSQFNEVNLAQQAGLRKAAAENVGGSTALARFDKASARLKNLKELSNMHFSMRGGVDSALKAADAELEASKLALAEKLPLVSAFASHSSLSVSDVQRALKSDEILILATPGQKTTNFVAITREKAAFASAVLGNEQLRKLINKLRNSVDPTLPEFDRDIPFNSTVSEEIYKSTLGSLAEIMSGKPNVYVVSSGIMASIPWQVLAKPRANPASRIEWLARDFSFFLSPSIRTLIYSKNNNQNKSNRGLSMIGFGDPEYGKVQEYLTLPAPQKRQSQSINTETARLLRSAIAPLPETRDEIEAVLRILDTNKSRTLFGTDASEDNIRALDQSGELGKYDVVYFATHGLLPGQLDGNNEPALVMSSPVNGSKNTDGLLSASEIAGMNFAADWVVMSACSTASANHEGGEALSGLSRAFFLAGAKSVLASHWPVVSQAAVELTTSTFRYLAENPKLSRPQALQRAMRDLFENESDPFRSHPAYWAPFVLVGS